MEIFVVAGITLGALFPLMNPLAALPLFASLTAVDPPSWRKKMALKSALFAFGILVASAAVGTSILNIFGISLGMLQIAGGLIVGHTAWNMSTGTPQLGPRQKKPHTSDLLSWARASSSSVVAQTMAGLRTVTHDASHPIDSVHRLAKTDPADNGAPHDRPEQQEGAQSEEGNGPDEPHDGGEQGDDRSGRKLTDISFSPMAMPMLAGPGAIGLVIGLVSSHPGFLDFLGIVLGSVVICFATWVCLRTAGPINSVLGEGGVIAMQRLFGLIVLAIAVSLIASGISAMFGIHIVG